MEKRLQKNLSYILQFFDSANFIASLLSSIANNLSEGMHRVKCKYRHDDKKCESSGIKHEHYDCFLEYTNFKNDLIEYKCLICHKYCQIKFNEKLKERFFNT